MISVEAPPPPPSGLSYSHNPVHYDEGVAITPNTPSFTGTVDLFSIDPPLGSLGLSLEAPSTSLQPALDLFAEVLLEPR